MWMICSGMANVGSPSSFQAEPLQGVVRKCEADASRLHGDLPWLVPGDSARLTVLLFKQRKASFILRLQVCRLMLSTLQQEILSTSFVEILEQIIQHILAPAYVSNSTAYVPF